MNRPTQLGAGLALLVATAAQAAPHTLGFTFAPLQCTSYVNAVPGGAGGAVSDCGLGSLSGDFTFDDANADGRVVLGELIRLNVGAISAPGLNLFGQPESVSAFDYAPATGLSFAASDAWRNSVTTGVSYRYVAPGGGNTLAWLPTTTTAIYAVPEPDPLWLWLAGGSVAGGWLRRARSATRRDRRCPGS